jgi:hypothetical protein
MKRKKEDEKRTEGKEKDMKRTKKIRRVHVETEKETKRTRRGQEEDRKLTRTTGT